MEHLRFGSPENTNKPEGPESAIILESSIEQAEVLRANSGVFTFITEKGGRPEKPNEDALVVDPEHDAFVVIDAMGGMTNPGLARLVVAEEFLSTLKSSGNLIDAHWNASRRMHRGGGACYTAFRIKKNDIEIQQGGDTGIIVASTVNKKVKHSLDQDVTSDLRKAVLNERGAEAPDRTFVFDFKNGDRIYGGSDGLWNNVDQEKIIQETLRMPIAQALAHIRTAALTEMHERTRPEFATPDNLTIFIYEKQPK